MTTLKQTLVIVGAGPQLGLSIAKKFGRNGFRVALIARRQEALERWCAHAERYLTGPSRIDEGSEARVEVLLDAGADLAAPGEGGTQAFGSHRN